jgi:hypothetical protein
MNNPGDDLLIISPLDQDIDVNDADVLSQIERLIMESIAEKDLQKALHICKQIYGIAKLSGKALAKVLYLIKSHWGEFGLSDNFEDTLTSVTGLTRHTIQTYTAVWDVFESGKIPEQFSDIVMGKNIKLIVPIAQTLNAGYEIDDDDWEELSDASDFSTVSKKLREIKGQPPRSNSLQIIMDRSGGLTAIKEDERRYVGWLNLDDQDDIVQQAIQRIIKGAGVLAP